MNSVLVWNERREAGNEFEIIDEHVLSGSENHYFPVFEQMLELRV